MRAIKNKTFRESIKCAIKGFFSALKSEKNFKYYFVIIAITLIANIIAKFSIIQYLIYGICIMGVFSSELLNTAVERVCDRITKEFDKEIGNAKDIAAASVGVWGIAFFTTEFVMLAVNIFG